MTTKYSVWYSTFFGWEKYKSNLSYYEACATAQELKNSGFRDIQIFPDNEVPK